MTRRTLLALCCAAAVPAADPDALAAAKRDAVLTYARMVHANYADCLAGAEALREALRRLVESPSAETMEAARRTWIAGRRPYGRSEVYRYYAGPIDDADGPEPLLNAWPLDEAWIEAVPGSADGGIIGSEKAYPDLTPQLIAQLNQQDGEKNVACGWHAIEFLLWGQDRRKDGPGERPWTDYSTAPHAARRGRFVMACADILVLQLADLVAQWAPDQLGNYRAVFEEGIDNSVERLLMGVIFLSGTELAGERLQVAWDTQEQEDEQSCFSDTTHLDLVANAEGLENVWLGRYVRTDGTSITGKGLRNIAAARDPALAEAIGQLVREVVARARTIPAPFDQAIRGSDDDLGRKAVFALITAAEELAIQARRLAAALGCAIPDQPPEDIEG